MRVASVAVVLIALVLAAPAEARQWSGTSAWSGSFTGEDAAYYQGQLAVPVTIQAKLKLRLTPEIVFGLVTKFVLTPGSRIVSVEATREVPDEIVRGMVHHAGPVWRLKVTGRYPVPPPRCIPDMQCVNHDPDFVDPTIVVRDLDETGFFFVR